MPAVKIFSESPFGSIAEPLARGCLVFCISWEKAEVVTPMADPSWSQDFTRRSKTQGCRLEVKRDAETLLPVDSITQLRESWGCPHGTKSCHSLAQLQMKEGCFTWWCSLPQKQTDADNKKCGEGAGSHMAPRAPPSPAAWVWTIWS